MFSWFRSKQSLRETWLQIYVMHIGMGIGHQQAMIYADEAASRSEGRKGYSDAALPQFR